MDGLLRITRYLWRPKFEKQIVPTVSVLGYLLILSILVSCDGSTKVARIDIIWTRHQWWWTAWSRRCDWKQHKNEKSRTVGADCLVVYSLGWTQFLSLEMTRISTSPYNSWVTKSHGRGLLAPNPAVDSMAIITCGPSLGWIASC